MRDGYVVTMAISKETILEFQRAVKEEYGREISFEEASEMTRDLVAYFDTLAKINHRMETEKESGAK